MEKCSEDKMPRLTSPTTTTTIGEVTFRVIDDYVPPAGTVPQSAEYYHYVHKSPEEIDSQIEYDMDEEDFAWLELVNESRKKDGLEAISEDMFELAMDRFEKESIFQCEFSAGEGGRTATVDEDAACSVCASGEIDTDNNILFCDLCNIAVHQVCYGVPKVPTGPWACRRCTLSPSRPVDCCLCPNGADGGAMKPTDDGRWAHVSCALWIPEVEFGCKSVREPVISVEKVASARWKLLCVVCRRRGGGACLQCRRTSCYTAFHVSCGMCAGLCIGTPTSDGDVAAFCDVHSSPASSSDAQRRLSSARKILSELQNAGPPLSIPVITTSGYITVSLPIVKICDRFTRIQEKLSLDKTDPFVSRLHCYWTLKRRSRNGAPLLRSMLYSFAHLARQRLLLSAESQIKKDSVDSDSDDLEEMVVQLKCWKRLRQDLEKARLLLELIRKRERVKSEQMRVESQLTALRLWPLITLLSRAADELYRLDCDGVLSSDSDSTTSNCQQIFLSTLRQRIADHGYRSADEFTNDVMKLLDGVADVSVSFKDKVTSLLDTVSKLADRADYEQDTGTHLIHSLSSVKRMPRKRDSKGASRVVKPAAATSTGRPRGRPKKLVVADNSTPANCGLPERHALGLSDTGGKERDGSVDAGKPKTSLSAGAVNRRTAVLFGNKTPRRSVQRINTQTASASQSCEARPARRPGRPPKHQQQRDVTERRSMSETRVEPAMSEEPKQHASGADAPKKRGRKKRSAVDCDSGEFGSRWAGKVVGNVSTQWSDTVHPAASNPVRRTPQKESFRQYRVMHDSDTEPAAKSDNDQQMASLSSSSSSTDSNSSSHSDDNEEEEASSNSSSSSSHDNTSSPSHHSGQGRKQHCRAQDMTTQLKPLDLVWAKCKGYPWYPAQVIDPELPRSALNDAGITVEAPPEDVLKLRHKYKYKVYLVVFYDSKRTWRWLGRRKLDPLGVDAQLDGVKLTANNKANVCAAVQRAYNRAREQTAASTPVLSADTEAERTVEPCEET